MTCGHVRLLGPCFKTGQTGGRLGRHRQFVPLGNQAEYLNGSRQALQLELDFQAPSRIYLARASGHGQSPMLSTRSIALLRTLDRSPAGVTEYFARESIGRSAQQLEVHFPGSKPPGKLNLAIDFSAPSVSFWVVSRPVKLSLQSSLQLSLTVLVCYRTRGNI